MRMCCSIEKQVKLEKCPKYTLMSLPYSLSEDLEPNTIGDPYQYQNDPLSHVECRSILKQLYLKQKSVGHEI